MQPSLHKLSVHCGKKYLHVCNNCRLQFKPTCILRNFPFYFLCTTYRDTSTRKNLRRLATLEITHAIVQILDYDNAGVRHAIWAPTHSAAIKNVGLSISLWNISHSLTKSFAHLRTVSEFSLLKNVKIHDHLKSNTVIFINDEWNR